MPFCIFNLDIQAAAAAVKAVKNIFYIAVRIQSDVLTKPSSPPMCVCEEEACVAAADSQMVPLVNYEATVALVSPPLLLREDDGCKDTHSNFSSFLLDSMT